MRHLLVANPGPADLSCGATCANGCRVPKPSRNTMRHSVSMLAVAGRSDLRKRFDNFSR